MDFLERAGAEGYQVVASRRTTIMEPSCTQVIPPGCPAVAAVASYETAGRDVYNIPEYEPRSPVVEAE